MLKVLVPELTGAPCHSSPCLPSQGFPFFDLSFLVELLKTSSRYLVWIQDFLKVLGLDAGSGS